jgi:hypothetical protein
MQRYHLALDLLERRYQVVADAPDDVALLHLLGFVRFIKQDSLVEPYARLLANKAIQQSNQQLHESQPSIEERS